MRLRFELELFLWVMTGALLTLILFRGDRADTRLEFQVTGDVSRTSDLASISASQSDEAPILLADPPGELAPGSRRIFDVPVPTAPAPPVDLSVPVRVLPVLKGIFSIGGQKRAVFMAQPDIGLYRSVASGDTIGDVTIIRVEADQVVAIDGVGTQLKFLLRGNGETSPL